MTMLLPRRPHLPEPQAQLVVSAEPLFICDSSIATERIRPLLENFNELRRRRTFVPTPASDGTLTPLDARHCPMDEPNQVHETVQH